MYYNKLTGWKAIKAIKTRERAVLKLRSYVLPTLMVVIILLTGLQATI